MEENKNNNMENQEELELTDKQVERLDELDNAAFEYLKVLTGNEELEWDMEFIGELNEFAAAMMAKAGHRIYYPYITRNEDGTAERHDYYEPEEPSVKMIDGGLWDSIQFDGFPEDGKIPENYTKYTLKVHTYQGGPIPIWARSEKEAREIADTFTEEIIRANATYGGMRIEKMEDKENG